MDLTRVSVVLPALNEAVALPVALASLPAEADLVVVDNGSTDTTARWLPLADPEAASSRARRDCNHQPPWSVNTGQRSMGPLTTGDDFLGATLRTWSRRPTCAPCRRGWRAARLGGRSLGLRRAALTSTHRVLGATYWVLGAPASASWTPV
jgi:hypothetical protein